MGPITYAAIRAWSEIAGIAITAFEAQVIRRLDDAVLAVIRDERDEERKQTTPPAAPGQPVVRNLTPVTDSAGIKAIFMGLGAKSASKPAKP